ncbi:MAG: CvpA family protein [bacterium]
MDFSYIDIILVGAVVLLILSGIYRGFIHTAGNLIGLILGILAAGYGMNWLEQNYAISTSPVWSIIIFLILVMIVSRLIGFLVDMANEAWNLISFIPFLKTINKLLGAVIGLIEGVLVLAAVAHFSEAYYPDSAIGLMILASPIIGWLSFVIKIVSWLFPEITIIAS